MGVFQSDWEMFLRLKGGVFFFLGMINEYWQWGVYLVWFLCILGDVLVFQVGYIFELRLRFFLGWLQDFLSEVRWKRRKEGFRNRGRFCSVIMNQGRIYMGRETLLLGVFLIFMIWSWRYLRLNQSEFRELYCFLRLVMRKRRQRMEKWEYGGCFNMVFEEAFFFFLI